MNDAELIDQIKKGNTNAFRYLVDKHRSLVWHLVLRMVKSKELAEDISQEVFLRVFKEISKFRGESKLSTWIGSITYNVTIDQLRKKGRDVINYEMDVNAGVNLFSDEPGPLADISRSEIIKLVHEIIEKLPLQYRTVITLFYLEEFSYDEIREITSMPVGTIKSYLNRGRKLISDTVANKIPELKIDYFEKL